MLLIHDWGTHQSLFDLGFESCVKALPVYARVCELLGLQAAEPEELEPIAFVPKGAPRVVPTIVHDSQDEQEQESPLWSSWLPSWCVIL